MGEKLARYESTTSKLQKNLENVLAEKFGDLDPSSAEFFLQEERLTQMKIEYERQCRELQDQIDELQSQLEAHRSQGKEVRCSLKSSLYEELADGEVESNREVGSEECNPLNMSIEAEMVIEQMKDQHHQDLCDLQQELENTIHHYKKQLEEIRSHHVEEKAHLQQKFCQEMLSKEQQVDDLQARVSGLQAELAQFRQGAGPEQTEAQLGMEGSVSSREALRLSPGGELHAQLEEACESFNREREELIQARVWMEAKMRSLAQTVQDEKVELEHGFCKQLQLLVEKHSLEKEQMQRELAEKHRQELREERVKMESEFNGRLSQAEEQFAVDRQALVNKYGEAVKNLEEHYQKELQELSELRVEEKSRWELEKEELIREGGEAQERWKEVLQKEKALSTVLAQEKELVEKNLKEHVNLLTMEKEQLQKEICELKKQEKELRDRLVQVQADHQKELREREEKIAAVEASRKQVSQKLEELETEFLHEREELNSRLVALEHSKEEAIIQASAKERELRLEVSKLESEVEELRRELISLSELQSNCVLGSQHAEFGGGDSSRETQGTREVRDSLPNLPEAHDPAGDEDMTNLSCKPQESTYSPAFCPLTPEIFVDSQLPDPTDEGNDEERGQDEETGDASGHTILETEMGTSEEMAEMCSALKKAYEEIRSENETLKLQKRQLQERICLLEIECEQAANERQDMACQVQKELDEILQAIPKPKMLPCSGDENEEKSHHAETDVTQTYPNCTAENRRFPANESQVDLSIEEVSDYSLPFWKDHGEAVKAGELKTEHDANDRAQLNVLALSEGLQLENQALKAEVANLSERNSKLENCLPRLMELQHRLEESCRASLSWELEKQQLQEKVKELEETQDQMASENRELQSTNLRLHSQLVKLEEFVVKALKGRPSPCAEGTKEAEVEKRGLQELNWKLKERVATLLKQNGTHAQEKDHLNAALRGLQCACGEQQQQLEHWRCEVETLREENAILRKEISLLTEEGNLSGLRLREMNGSRELWQKIEAVRKEKVTAQKMAENLKKQVSELKARNQQLEVENASLGLKTSPNQPDSQDLNQQLLRALRQRERESGKCAPEEWERERSRLKEELENCKIQSSTLVSSLEAELCHLRAQACAVEQENLRLKQQLEKAQQISRCPGLSDFQNEISSVIVKNEKLVKEKEALSEELSRSTEKAAKVDFLENLVASLKQEKGSVEHQMQLLKTQMVALQDKVSRIMSDYRVTQQENEALKQEVMSLHKQVQTANDKNRVLELAAHSTGLQSQPKKLCWEEVDQLAKQEQQLLRQDAPGGRPQWEVHSAKAELTHSREKRLHPSASVRHSQSLHPRESQPHQPQGCTVVPWEQYQQLRHQLFQAERRSQRLQEELENRPPDTNMPQGLLPEQRSLHADTYRRIGHL